MKPDYKAAFKALLDEFFAVCLQRDMYEKLFNDICAERARLGDDTEKLAGQFAKAYKGTASEERADG